MSRWTAEVDAELRRLHAEGETFEAIRRKLRTTWHSVAKRARRLGLLRHAVQPRKRAEAVALALQPPKASPLDPGARTLPRLGDLAPPAPAVDVVYRTCRFIPGPPAGAATVFCDAPVLAGCCYCPAHHARCFLRKAEAA